MPHSTSQHRTQWLCTMIVSLLMVFVFADESLAQTPSEQAAQAASGLSFRDIGPAVMGGRVADIAVVESDPRIFYVGLGAGGVWKTTNDGMTWESLFDDQPTASIGDVTIAPSNPNVVWVGTGEPQNRQSSPWGVGVFKSTDAGRTWNHMGLEDTRHVGRIAIDHTNPDVVFVGAVGHLWGSNEDRGVFRTTDGGDTWTKVLYIDRDDFREDPPKKYFRLAPGREVRLRYGYFIKCEKAIKQLTALILNVCSGLLGNGWVMLALPPNRPRISAPSSALRNASAHFGIRKKALRISGK